MGGEYEDHEISQNPTSQLEVEPRSTPDLVSPEVSVRILVVDVSRGVAEQSVLKVALRRHIF